jgi:pimeloyl-ACP methyl ester carboxylesterase
LEESPEIAGVLALAPVADLADAYRQKLGEGAVAELLGGGPEAHAERYAATDTGALPAPDVPVVLVHGALDDRVPVAQSQRYPAPLVELPDVEHFGVIDPLSPAWPAVLGALKTLLRAADT